MNVLIYSTVFIKKDYVDMITLLLGTYTKYGFPNKNITYLIICSSNLLSDIMKIKQMMKEINIQIWSVKNEETHSLKNTLEACFYRYNIFSWPQINNYDRILYLDADILITNKISNIIQVDPGKKIYVLAEGDTTDQIHGSELFEINPNISAFTSGIILFNNCINIKTLFSVILQHCKYLLQNDIVKLRGADQPLTVYHAVKMDLYDNTKLQDIVINNPKNFSGHTISHFAGPFVGCGNKKIPAMIEYLKKYSNELSR